MVEQTHALNAQNPTGFSAHPEKVAVDCNLFSTYLCNLLEIAESHGFPGFGPGLDPEFSHSGMRKAG
jgi:hypothetical protein